MIWKTFPFLKEKKFSFFVSLFLAVSFVVKCTYIDNTYFIYFPLF